VALGIKRLFILNVRSKTLLNERSQVLGILILSQNGKRWLPALYTSIRAQTYPYIRIYLVDNASEDESVEMTGAKYPEVKVIRLPKNLGYSMAYNLSMPYAFEDGCDWVIWANNDVRIEPNCLNELARAAQSDPKIGVLGPAFLGWNDDDPNYYMVGNHPYAIGAMKSRSREPIDVEWVEGSFLMVRRRCVEAVGPLDPYYFMYSEESDFCRRARYQGWKVLLVPSALARHYAAGSSEGKQEISRSMIWLQSRNYYVYHLANPFRSFFRNVLQTAHVSGVKVKEHLRNKSMRLVLFETRVFLAVMRDLRTIYRKWLRDKTGLHPAPVTPDLQALKPEILRNGNYCLERHDLPLDHLRQER
jgi:GT2 family glycosyltransferase